MDRITRARHLFFLCFYTVIALTIIIATCGTIAYNVSFDESIGYLNPSPLTVICNIAALLAVGASVVLPLFIPADTLSATRPLPTGATGYLFGIIPGVALAAFTVISLVSLPPPTGLPARACVWVTLPAAAYFILSAVPTIQKKPLILSLVGIFPMLWALLCIAETYTDWTMAINSPIKLSVQFGCISVPLMITAEHRYRFGKAMPRLAICLYCLAILFCLGAGIPLTLRFSQEPSILRYSLCLFAIGLYCVKSLADFILALPTSPVNESEE